MPGWSPEIANEFIRLGAEQARSFDQLQLQGLVYLAHGWCLAFYDRPLTGDRPEAWEFGPMYRRLADALARYGREQVTKEILNSEAFGDAKIGPVDSPARSDLDQSESDLIQKIYQTYGSFESRQLSAIACDGDSPWKLIFADGAGCSRDIPHDLIRDQFVKVLRQADQWQASE